MAGPVDIRVAVGMPFPALVQGIGGISVTKANGLWTIQPNFAALSQLGNIPTPAQKLVQIYDTVTKTYNTASVSTLVAGVVSALTPGSVVFAGATGLTQDNSNFFWDATNKRLGIGTATPDSPISVNLNASALQAAPSGSSFAHFQGANNVSNQMTLVSYGLVPASHNAISHVLLAAARGTPLVPAAVGVAVDFAPTWQGGAGTVGDYLGFYGGGGHDGTGWYYGASIAFRPAELWSATNHGAGIMFGVTPIGAAGVGTYRFWMHPNGYFVVNGNSAAPPALVVAGSSSLQLVAADTQRATIDLWTYGNAANFFSQRANGIQSALTTVGAAATLLGFACSAYNGSAYIANANMLLVTDQAQTGSISSTYTSFSNTPKGSALIQENVRFWGAGGVSIGSGNVATEPAAGVVMANAFRIGANQVVGARITGYTAMTGSPDKATAYATGTVTLPQLAGRVAQLQADLTTHGLIGA